MAKMKKTIFQNKKYAISFCAIYLLVEFLYRYFGRNLSLVDAILVAAYQSSFTIFIVVMIYWMSTRKAN